MTAFFEFSLMGLDAFTVRRQQSEDVRVDIRWSKPWSHEAEHLLPRGLPLASARTVDYGTGFVEFAGVLIARESTIRLTMAPHEYIRVRLTVPLIGCKPGLSELGGLVGRFGALRISLLRIGDLPLDGLQEEGLERVSDGDPRTVEDAAGDGHDKT